MRNIYIVILATILILLFYTVDYSQNIKGEIKIGQKFNANLMGGETHNYQLYVNENTCIYIVVEQMGIDVEVNLYNPKGEKVFNIDSPNGSQGPEPVLYITQEAGIYRAEVISPNLKVAPGKYELSFKEAHIASEEDKILVESGKLFDQTEVLHLENKNDSLDVRKQNYEKLLLIYQDASKKYSNSPIVDLLLPRIAGINLRLGQIDFSNEKYLESIEKYKKVLGLCDDRTISDVQIKAHCLANIGESLKALGNNEDALKNYLNSLPLYEKAENTTGQLIALNNIGTIYDLLGSKKRSADYYLKALTLAEKIGDESLQATIYSNLALVFEDLEEHQEAINYYQKSLEIFTKNKRVWNVGIVYSNIGALYDNLGNYEKALQNYDEAIKRFDEVKTLVSKAKTLVNVGSIYANPQNSNKNFETAKNVYSQSLEIFTSKNDLRGIANVLTKIGALEVNTNPLASISTLSKALELRQKTLDFYGEAYTHLILGNAFVATNNYPKAFEQYAESLRINRKIGDKRGESTTLYQIAKLQQKANMLEMARKTIEEAIDIVEFSRLNVNINNLRISYLARSQQFYELYIDLLMRSGEQALAFNVSEKSRSRSLLENLSKIQDEHIDQELLAHQRNQSLVLNQKIEKIVTLKRDGRENEIPAIDVEIERIKAEMDTTESKIREARPIESNAKPLTLSLIQKDVLDLETALIEYSLGDEYSYAWVVTKDSIKSYRLPNRKVLEELADDVFRYVTVRENQTVFSDEKDIIIGDKRYIEKSKELSSLILEPIVENLAKNRLVFVVNGKLVKIPFSALPITVKKSYVPLISKFEVTFLPSGSILGVVRSQEVIEHEKNIAIIADPIFSLKDQRVKSQDPNPSKNEITLREKTIQRRGIEFDRLPFTETEGAAIVSVVPKNKKYDKYIGFDATLETVLRIINEYNILHFSTHAISENFYKGISAIVLSLIDEKGQPIDGILSSDVVSSLNLNLDLVVLAACDTARGKSFAGEGVIGLARSFIYAGTKSVITTGWEVNDEATAKLMKSFYTEVFINKVNYSTALRRAQLSMLKSQKYSHPFYWAPFSFQGDYKLHEK